MQTIKNKSFDFSLRYDNSQVLSVLAEKVYQFRIFSNKKMN